MGPLHDILQRRTPGNVIDVQHSGRLWTEGRLKFPGFRSTDPRAVASSSALYGSIGVVFAVLAWLFLLGRLLVYAATLNVVLWERRHGTVTVEMSAPNLPGREPLEAHRRHEDLMGFGDVAKA